MPKAKIPVLDFTNARVLAAPVGMHRDEELDYLYLRVSETGARTFRYSAWGKADKQPMNVSIGSHRDYSVDKARTEAIKIHARNRNGESLRKAARVPVVVKDVQEDTFQQVVDRYTARLKRENKRAATWLADAFRLSFNDWGDLPLSAISERVLEDTINAVHDDDKRGPGAARTALKAMRAIYKAAKFKGDSPVAMKMVKQKPRQRVLSAAEKASFIAALHAEGSKHLKPFFQLLMKTGARRGNLEACEWEEINFDTRWWTIPEGKSKSGKTMKVRLHPDAVAILQDLKAAPGAHAKWVFESPVMPDQHLGDTWQQFKRIAEAAGLPKDGPNKVTPHDLRRSFGSDLMAAGVPLAVVSKALGHGSLQTTLRHYIVAGDDFVGSEVDRVAL